MTVCSSFRYPLAFVFAVWGLTVWATPMALVAQDLLPLTEDAHISLLTISEGDQIHSYWGHNALRVYDPGRGLDRTFNYGTFQFDAYFVPNFLYGKLDYYLSVPPTPNALEHYRTFERRTVVERVLQLNQSQKDALFRFLVNNAQPENRVYRYNFLYDNCATRIRDALETTLGDAVTFAPEPDPQESFRTLFSRPVAHLPFLGLGINLILGMPTDKIASAREVVFLPPYLDAVFLNATIDVGEGPVPLVARTDTLVSITDVATDSTLPWADLLFWLVFGLFAWLTYRTMQRQVPFIRFGDGLLFFVIGCAGLLMVGLWFFTLHEVTTQNWNVLWAWPTHAVIAFFIWRRKRAAWLRYYMLGTAVLSLITLLGWFIWPQDLHSAVVPLCLTLALRGGWIGMRMSRQGEVAS